MSGSVTRAVLWLVIVLTILFLGWTKPLRYVFMSAGQIAQEEREEAAAKNPPKPAPTPWKPLSTALDHKEKSH